MTFAAIVVAWPEHLAKDSGIPRTKCGKAASIIFNLLLTCLAVTLNILAVRYGAIAVVTPITSGANLLSNLIIQPCLGLASYSQDAVIGTLVLVSSVTMLIEVGPSDIDPDAPVLELLLRPVSLIFIASALFMMLFSLCAITFKWTTDNMKLTLLYSIVGGAVIVLNTALTKVVQMEIPLLALIPLVLLYVVFAVIGLSNGASANGGLEDASLFVPVGAGVQLVLTCVAGLCIWGDGSRLPVPMSYGIIYLLVCIGTVLLCNADILGITQELIKEAHVLRASKSMGYQETDLHPAAPRGKLQRQSTTMLDRPRFKKQLKSNVQYREDAVDKLLDMWEKSILEYSPGLWHSTKFQVWVRDTFQMEIQAREPGDEYTPLSPAEAPA